MRLLYNYILILLLATSVIQAEDKFTSTPLMPAKNKTPGYSGIFIGAGQNFQSGKYFVDCKECEFENGVASGFLIGIFYDRKALSWLKYGISGAYNLSGIENSFVEFEKIHLQSDNSGIDEDIWLQFRHKSEVKINMLTAMPYIKLEPFDFFFFKTGFSLSYIFNSNIKHEKELMQNEVTLSNGATIIVSIPDFEDSNKKTIQDSEIRELNSLQYAISLSSGVIINFSPTTFFSPYFQYNLPLTNISESGDDYKINQWRIIFELGFKIH